MSSSDPTPWVVGGFFTVWAIMMLVMVALGIFFTVFWIVEIIDVARREFPDPNMKILWLLVVILSHGIGALVYYFVGKKQGVLPGESLPPPRAGY